MGCWLLLPTSWACKAPNYYISGSDPILRGGSILGQLLNARLYCTAAAVTNTVYFTAPPAVHRYSAKRHMVHTTDCSDACMAVVTCHNTPHVKQSNSAFSRMCTLHQEQRPQIILLLQCRWCRETKVTKHSHATTVQRFVTPVKQSAPVNLTACLA